VQSAANNVINLEVPLSSLNRALKSALNATSAQIRLTKKDNMPMLALTIVTTTSSNSYSAFPTPGANNDDGFDAPFDNAFGGNRETVVTQEIPVRVLPPDIVANLHEPHTRDPDVHIILPPLIQLKSISDRFTKLALAVKDQVRPFCEHARLSQDEHQDGRHEHFISLDRSQQS
jgi:HUS1 checkpoint protein